jgi:hypothetical protein
LASGATSLLDVTVAGARQGDLADAALASYTRLVEVGATAWASNTVWVMARNISSSAFGLGAATLSLASRSAGSREAAEGAARSHAAADR